jgi:hypothetical protein
LAYWLLLLLLLLMMMMVMFRRDIQALHYSCSALQPA